MSWRMLVLSALIAVIFAFLYFLSRSGLKDTIRPSSDKVAGVGRKDCNQNKIAASAYWAIGLSYYREGGEDGLSLAGTFFQSFLQTYPDCQPQELVPAAQIDIAATYIDRMRLAEKEPARERAAQGAATALKTFLDKWPDSPQAYAASLALVDLQNYLSKPR